MVFWLEQPQHAKLRANVYYIRSIHCSVFDINYIPRIIRSQSPRPKVTHLFENNTTWFISIEVSHAKFLDFEYEGYLEGVQCIRTRHDTCLYTFRELLSGPAACIFALNTCSRNLGILKGGNTQGINTPRDIDARIRLKE
jgi:hypothetical protein